MDKGCLIEVNKVHSILVSLQYRYQKADNIYSYCHFDILWLVRMNSWLDFY